MHSGLHGSPERAVLVGSHHLNDISKLFQKGLPIPSLRRLCCFLSLNVTNNRMPQLVAGTRPNTRIGCALWSISSYL